MIECRQVTQIISHQRSRTITITRTACKVPWLQSTFGIRSDRMFTALMHYHKACRACLGLSWHGARPLWKVYSGGKKAPTWCVCVIKWTVTEKYLGMCICVYIYAWAGALLQECISVCLTSYACGSIGWYVGVHCDLRVEDAAVGVGVHLQRVQQLSVVLHSVVVHAALLRDQLRGALWTQKRHAEEGRRSSCWFHIPKAS